MRSKFVVTPARLDEMPILLDWAADEGWNPGLSDAACFHAADTQGFLVGRLDGQPVSGISLVQYGDVFAFLGFYLCRPEMRGRGFGYAVWSEATRRFGARVVGLDGVPAQQDNYRRSGFALSHRNIRYQGAIPSGLKASGTTDTADAVQFPALEQLDARHFGTPRRAFLSAWLAAEGHVARLLVRDGALVGYGVLRRCRHGTKIGPLFAPDATGAEALLTDLAMAAPPGPIVLDVPEPNADAVALAERWRLEPVFETARMYRGQAPNLPISAIFGITTFELG
jgi:GNAT superfamily N-acetyltransferase